MKDQNLANFESQLERLIEGAFAHLFSKSVRAQDIALQLARAMEGEAGTTHTSDPRPVAPDHYIIIINPGVREHLLTRQPALAQILSQHMVELATNAGYRLKNIPNIEIEGDDALPASGLRVEATHGDNLLETNTEVMRRTEMPVPQGTPPPRGCQLIINGEQTLPIKEPVVNIGRSRDNHVVLEDPFISRHHAQMRLRFGHYTLFDIQSQTGTFVNDERVSQHQLQTGDVIRVGKTRLVYLEDEPPGETQPWLSGAEPPERSDPPET
jgi:hypothetical protein